MRTLDRANRTLRAAAATGLMCCVAVTACGLDTGVDTSAPPPMPTTTSTTEVAEVAPEVAEVAPGPTAEQVAVYVDALNWAAAAGFAQAVATYVEALRAAEASRVVPARPAVAVQPRATGAVSRASGGVPANGFLTCVRNRESRGDYTAVNSSSGAGGAYQFLPSTWRALGGTGLPQNASPAEQDAMAARLYAQAGRAPWAGPGC